MTTRRSFLKLCSLLLSGAGMGFTSRHSAKIRNKIMTVKGPIDSKRMGNTLIHEHILVDFIGAEKYDPTRWNDEVVVRKVLPFLEDLYLAGCNTLVDCTPAYLGRDVALLERLSTLTGLNIITNTGYYGGSDNKFLPAHAFTETEEELAARWLDESVEGIDGTTLKPGFIKISVNPGPLSDISKKLVRAAARCHERTGLTIASHTGPAQPALEQLAILREEGVKPEAFIWVHAQNEENHGYHIVGAKRGAWVSLDGLNENNVSDYVSMLSTMKKNRCLHRTLVSHDAGWYDPAKTEGGEIRGYTTLFRKLIPALEQAAFSTREIQQLIHGNPVNAFSIRVRRI